MNCDVFEEIKIHILNDDKPSLYLNRKDTIKKINKSYINILGKLITTEQSKIYHPEGSVWNHTLMVVDNAAKLRKYANDKEAFMLAALFHDIGKVETTQIRRGRLTSYNHDSVGGTLVRVILQTLGESKSEEVSILVRYHMYYLYISKNLPYGNMEELLNSGVDLRDISLLFIADRLGRGGMNNEDMQKSMEDILLFSSKINRLDISELIGSFKI